MASIYDKISEVISQPDYQRTDFQVQEIAPWLKNKVGLFAKVNLEIVKDVIKQCGFRRCPKDEVIIKQGDNGDRLYIVLKGSLSIYHMQDRDSNEEILSLVNAAIENSHHGLDREKLGQKVWTSGEGSAFGEVALIKPDCIRTATVVVDEEADLMVVDRNLYNESVRDVLEHEFQLKTRFVENDPLYRFWSARHRKQLAISLRLERYEFGSPLARQGQEANKAFYIQKGEVEVTIHPSLHKTQFPSLWSELEKRIPILTESSKSKSKNSITPHEKLQKRRKAGGKHQEIGLLGENEFVGCLEFSLRLQHYVYTANCTSSTEVLVLHRDQYDRFFEKRYPESIPVFQREVGLRLNLYLERIQEAPLMEYMLLLLENSYVLEMVNKSNEKTLTLNDLSAPVTAGTSHQGLPHRSPRPIKKDTGYGKLMDQMQSRYTNDKACEPDSETKSSMLELLELRIKKWLATTSIGIAPKANGNKKTEKSRISRLKTFQVNDLTGVPRPGNRIAADVK